MGEEEGDHRPTEALLQKLSESSYNSSQERLVQRTGTVWTAMAHIVTAVIGSGVLSLAWSVAQLGWVGGPAAIVLFAGVTVVQSSLLADCYISDDPDERGAVVRNKSYVQAVRLYLGEKSRLFCGFFISFSLFGSSVVYTLTSATSMRAIQKSGCRWEWATHGAHYPSPHKRLCGTPTNTQEKNVGVCGTAHIEPNRQNSTTPSRPRPHRHQRAYTDALGRGREGSRRSPAALGRGHGRGAAGAPASSAMADPPPPAVGEGLLPPPFLPVAPPPIPVVDAPPLVLEDEKLCKERRIEGMLSQEHKVGGEIHDPRSNMGTCKEFPRSKKRKPQIQEQPTETRMQSQSTNNNTETSKQIKSGVSKKFKSSKNKGAAAALPPVDTMLHKEKMRPEINGDIDVRKEIIGSRRKGRLAISTSPRVTSSPGVNILINATAHRRESINEAAHRRESINEAAHIRPKMTGSPEGSNSQESLNSPSQQPPISPSLHDLSPDGRMTSSYGWTRGRRKLLSRIWKEVEPIYQGNKLVKGRCGHCQKIFPASRDSGSSQIGRHLKVCPAKLAKNEMVDKMGRPEGIDPDWKFDPVIARRKLVKFIVVNEMPFLLVESSSFREFTKSLNPWFENVSRTTLKNDCEAAFQMHGDRMKKYFENLDSRVSLTGDMWTSNQKLGYLCMTCHFISDDWKLHKSIIRFSMMETPHNSLNMFDVVLRSIQEWNIEDKLFSFTLDNASVNIAMLNHLRENLENKGFLVSNGVLLHYRCGTHVFNIIAQYGLKEVKPTVNNIRESCKFVKSSQTRVEKFLDIVMQVGLTSRYKSPLVDVTTRWNSTYLMLEASLPLRGAFSSLEKHDKDYAFAPLATEWKLAEAVCKLLRVFYTATNTLSGSNYPTSHLYFYQLWNIKKTLNKEEASLKMKIRNKEASSQDHIIDRMVQQMQIKFNEYWLESYKSACIPVIFDPRFKYDLLDYLLRDFGNEEEVGTWMGEVKKTMQKIFDEYNLEVSAHSQREMDSPNTEEVEVEDDPLVEWDQHMRSKRRQASNELDCYLKEELLPRKKEVDILQWWKVSSSKYPVLSKMARDILAIPASTVPSESAFSTGGRVVSDYRSSLSSSTVEILICLQDWFKAAELERA